MIPNALVVAFDDTVSFEPAEVQLIGPAYSRIGTLLIPADSDGPNLPGWIVDGQQRAAAIRDAEIAKFPICVTAFITSDAQEQREQFILVNSTKPLPKGLIYELLPNTESKLPSILQRRRFPAYLVDRLNFDADSPMRGMIQTPTNPGGVVKDNSMLRMLEQSLSEGMLYHFRERTPGGAQTDKMLSLLKDFWGAVAEVFPDAWNKSPRRSRLMHGAGIICMGLLMDAVADRTGLGNAPSKEEFITDLRPLIPVCKWTNGYWEFGTGAQRKWNEIQNTAKDIQLLANYLLYQYKALVWDQALKRA
jgi:DGQHR domain-containing protein